MDFIDSFYQKDEKGKTGAERSGERNTLQKKGVAVNAIMTLSAVELLTRSNPEDAREGEKYALIKLRCDEILEGNTHPMVVGIEYTMFFDFDTKTMKKARQAKEFNSFCGLVADFRGEPAAAIAQTDEGKAVVREFLVSGGEGLTDKPYHVFSESTGADWHKFRVEAVPPAAPTKGKK